MAVGGLVSSFQYVHYWHHDNAGREYVRNLQASLRDHQGPADLPPQILPGNVMPSYSEPDNSSDVFLPLAGVEGPLPGHQRRPDGHRLQRRGRPGAGQGRHDRRGRARCPTAAGSSPPGSSTIPLGDRTYDWPWWLRIGYLSSQNSPITVSVGDSTHVSEVTKGLGALYVRAPGVFDHVTIGGLAPGTTLCVDSVEVGDPVPARTIE